METFGQRLRKERIRLGLSQDALAKRVNPAAGQSFISNFETDTRQATAWIVEIASALGVDPFWLKTGQGDREPSGNTLPGPLLRGSVPLISWVQAGDWSEIIDNLQPGEGERIETTWRASANAYALRVRGDSMEPKFPAGAILIVEPNENPEPGKYVIVRQNGDTEATFKQLIQDGGTLYLKPLNDRYPIMMLRPDAVFCGVVKRMEMDV